MYRIGIDLGGTNIAVGVVNDRYEIVARRSVPTGAERPAEEVIRDMGDAVEEALRQAGLTAVDCASMGVGSPGAATPQTGVVKRAYNLNWFDVPVCRMLHQRFGIPVRLGNDANCAALAEVVAGAAVGCQGYGAHYAGNRRGQRYHLPWKNSLRPAGRRRGKRGICCWCWTVSPAPAAAGLLGGLRLRYGPDPPDPSGGAGASGVTAGSGGGDHRSHRLLMPPSRAMPPLREVVARYAVYVAAGLTELREYSGPGDDPAGGRHQPSGEAPAGPCPGVCGHPLFRSAGKGPSPPSPLRSWATRRASSAPPPCEGLRFQHKERRYFHRKYLLFVLWGKAGCRRQKPDTPQQNARPRRSLGAVYRM